MLKTITRNSMLLVLFLSSMICAQNVTLRPAYIGGRITLGEAVVSGASITAGTGVGIAARAALLPPGGYYLTVNTPESGTIRYAVRASVFSDNGWDYIEFPAETVQVNTAQTVANDFVVANPAIVSGGISIGSGATFKYGWITIAGITAEGKSYKAESGIDQTFQYSLPVIPGSKIILSGEVTVSAVDGDRRYMLARDSTVTVAGEQFVKNWDVDVAFTGGSTITSQFTFNGASNADGVYIGAYGPTEDGQGRQLPLRSQFWHFYSGAEINTPFAESALNPGSWSLYTQLYSDDYQSTFTFPCSVYANGSSLNFNLAQGSVADKSINEQAGYITGTTLLSGQAEHATIASATVLINGILGTRTEGGAGQFAVNLGDGSYGASLTSGPWQANGISYVLSRTAPDSFLNCTLSVNDLTQNARRVEIVAGQRVSNHDFLYETGEVTVTFNVSNGLLLKNPQLKGYAVQRDPNTGLALDSSAFSATGTDAEGTEGRVSFIGVKGVYRVTAWAEVAGSQTQFGTLDIEVLPNIKKAVDVAGPNLTILSPIANQCVTGDLVTISGRASDDIGVTSLMVNGVPVSFNPTGNPEDPREVSFETVLPAVEGVNTITVTAGDEAGKIAIQQLDVFKDALAPVIGAVTPADGFTGNHRSMVLSGVATDNAGVASVAINGLNTFFTNSGNVGDAQEVRFSRTMQLTAGGNAVTIVVTDACGNRSTRILTIVLNQAPVARAGDDRTLPVDQSCLVTTLLDANASADPDGDALTYTWSGSFGTMSGVSPEVTLGKGRQTVYLTVIDEHGLAATDSAVILVVDQTAPVPVVSALPIVYGDDIASVTDVPLAADNCDGTVSGVTTDPLSYPIPGTYQVTWRYADGAGNFSTQVQQVVVRDATPPVIVSLAASPAVLFPANNKMTRVVLTALTTDNSAELPRCRIVSVTSNEPQSNLSLADWVIVGDMQLDIRAQRDEKGTGRIYSITVSCTDTAGNTVYAITQVTVPRSKGK